MKTFLLIEPSISTLPLIFKATEKNDKILIISKYIDHFTSMKDTQKTTLLFFFQADTEDHTAILHLIDKISKTFCIDAVIPGSFSSLLITNKVCTFLKKAGLSPEGPYSRELKPYFTKVIEKLSLNYALFEAKIGISKNTLILREFNVELAPPPISELIENSMGIDYYDNVLRLFSYENLSLYKKQFLNTGSLFFNKSHHAQFLKQHPYVKETKLYSDHEKYSPPSLKAAGYALLIHKNYETLKNQMIELQLACSN